MITRSGSTRRPSGAHRLPTAAAAVLTVVLGTSCSGPHHDHAQAQGTDATPATASAQHRTTAFATAADDGVLQFTGSDGPDRVTVGAEVNDDPAGYAFTVHDTVHISTDGMCSHPGGDGNTVRCVVPLPSDLPKQIGLEMRLGGGDDEVTVDPGSHVYALVRGGSGDDVLRGGRRDVLYGDSGDDLLYGGGGIYGEGAYGGPGKDVLTGCGDACHQ